MAYTFEEFVYDEDAFSLRRGAASVPLQRQPSRVLAYFLEHPGRVISRTELARHVWPDGHHVDVDQGLNYCVRQVRRALADDVATPRFVETVPHMGYRWIAQTRRVSSDASSHTPGPAWWSRPVPLGAAVATSALCCALSGVAFYRLGTGVAPSIVAAYTPSDHLRQAVGALHVLSHALVDPDRRDEARPAVDTLWRVVASHATDDFGPTGR